MATHLPLNKDLWRRFGLITLMVEEDEVHFRLMGGEEPFLVPHYLLFASWSLGKEFKKEMYFDVFGL